MVGRMFMRVIAKCAHQLRPPPNPEHAFAFKSRARHQRNLRWWRHEGMAGLGGRKQVTAAGATL